MPEASATWREGDLVVLKSGGPVMTIKDVNGSASILCAWFAGKKHEQAYFSAKMLRAKTDDDK